MFEKEKKTRSFGGKITDFADKKERAFETKHLRAYLKGKKQFQHGKDPDTKEPIMFDVKEVWL